MIRWICHQKCMSLIYYNNSLQLVTLFFTFLATISSSANCRAKCLNKGICHSNTVCYCTDDFIGAQCEIPVRKFWVFVKLFFFFVKIKFLSLFNFNWFAKHCMISIGSILMRKEYFKHNMHYKQSNLQEMKSVFYIICKDKIYKSRCA